MRFNRFPVLLSLLTLLLATGTAVSALPAQALIPSAPDGTHGASRNGRTVSTVAARRALEHARNVLTQKSPDKAKKTLASGRDATMALTNLFVHRDEMASSDQTEAARMLARPTAGKRLCSTKVPVCIHYVSSGDDKSSWSWVKTVRGVMEHVYTTYKKAGYRRPVGDGYAGGKKNYIDIYLRDVYDQGYYGYCSPDGSPAGAPKGSTIAKAYCVLDNDYARSQYGTRHTPVENLKVTAAHEFFHAIQFGYDAGEDVWLMEGTAVWAEDAIYDGINDNVQYLPYGQLRHPRTALDKAGTYNVYGNWIFFRYLTERFPKKSGPLPVLIRYIWQQADSTHGKKKNAYSIQAVTRALKKRGGLRKLYLQFSEANHHSQRSYSEGRAQHYPVAPVTKAVRLRPAHKKATATYSLNHLTSASTRFVPQNVRPAYRLHVTVHLPHPGLQAATVTVYRKSGKLQRFPVKLGRRGWGSVSVPFDNTHVTKAELTMVNAAHIYKCWKGTSFSCRGNPQYNGLKDHWAGRLVRK